MSNLYEITGQYLQLQDLLESGEYDEETLQDTLEAIGGEYDDQVESCCKVIRNLEASVSALKFESKQMADKAKTFQKSIDTLKANLFNSMKATGIKKAGGAVFTVSIQKNGGKTPVITAPDADTSKLPDQLVIVTEKPNLDAIRELLEAGKVVEGFSLGERGESLRIK